MSYIEKDLIEKGYRYSFESSNTKYSLTLMHDGNEIGSVEANIENGRGHYNVHIFWVQIDDHYQNQGLCFRIMKYFIREVIRLDPRASFILENLGGYPSCRCYVKAFNECDYHSFKIHKKTGELIPITLDQSTNQCKTNSNGYMVFRRKKRGGYRSTRNKIKTCRKTRKRV